MKKKQIIKGYKASYDGVCRGKKYTVGETYTLFRRPRLCKCGFHYCLKPNQVFEYYPYDTTNFVLFEVEALGMNVAIDNKSVTNKIRIVREVPRTEYKNLFNGVNYTFDDLGRLVKRVFNDGECVLIQYDDQNRKIRMERSESGYWKTWEYNGDSKEHGISKDSYGLNREF